MSELVVIGDQAWTRDEWEAAEARRLRRRDYDRRYSQTPQYKARRQPYMAEWRAKHREELRAYNREWMTRYRAEQRLNKPKPAGYLHSLSCLGHHRRPRGTCVPIPVYAKREAAA